VAGPVPDNRVPRSGPDPLAKTTTKPRRRLALVVLAAGKGKRMRSASQKVLTPVCGKPALWHVLHRARAVRPVRIVIVVGKQSDAVRDAVRAWGVTPGPVFVDQGELLGTGHAVMMAERAVGRADDVLVANGDFDPVTPEDLRSLLRTHRRTKSAASVLTAELDHPVGYGHVVRERDRLIGIVEHADATAEERRIHEVATNWVVFRRDDLYRALPLVGRDNRQGEYYLKDVYGILADKGERVSAIEGDTGGAMGLNSRAGLAAVERVVRSRINDRHLASGVTMVDPGTTYVDEGVRIGPDTVLRPMTFLEGDTRIGSGCEIGPNARIVDSRVGDGTTVSFAVVLGSTIGKDASVGPFVRLRPGVKMADRTKAGAFVDLKNATIGEDSKVPHLSYVGDAVIGKRVNIGAGNVFANYDGYEKHTTVVDDDARTGADTILVAPVRIGKGAVTGASSVIRGDVPAGALAVDRPEQKVVKGYRKRKDSERGASEKGH
jgi:bifunctional UDP-N-acetylglucosamine pyrophosphorylase/glucosamine-1-phosphate N-acetyltransferase